MCRFQKRTVVALLLGLAGMLASVSAQEQVTVKKKAAGASAATAGATADLSPGQKLYRQHCAACHGEKGDGRGQAAVFVFPKPRDFSTGKFKLMSTANQVVRREELEEVLQRGMPGSSMPPWGHLSKEDRSALVDQVLRLTKVGLRERYIENLKKTDGLSDDEIAEADTQKEIAEFLAARTTPDEVTEVPKYGKPDAAAIARGKELFVSGGCAACHGNTGKGDGVQKMVDEDGTPTRPRDLTRGIYKGGFDPASLHYRIALGMPGTPMPRSQKLDAAGVQDVVHFIRSLSTEEQRQGAGLKRKVLTARQLPMLGADAAAVKWAGVPAITARTMPLWWRDDADVELSIQAVHDGKSLAVRVSWPDASNDKDAIHADQFEDMVAMQLTSAVGHEPIIAMGDKAAQVELWQWRAGKRSAALADALSDDYPFDSPEYRKLVKGPLPDFITARAAGNPLAVSDAQIGSLAARGFGSSTFLPKVSQLVTAVASWSEGRWSVVFMRPLVVPADAGTSLAVGKPAAVAFAVWNGAYRDRAGQKAVTIWQELRLDSGSDK